MLNFLLTVSIQSFLLNSPLLECLPSTLSMLLETGGFQKAWNKALVTLFGAMLCQVIRERFQDVSDNTLKARHQGQILLRESPPFLC